MQARNQLTKAIKERYMKVSKKEKGRILDEYCASTGYNRKYAIYKIRHFIPPPPGRPKKKKRSRRRIYDGEVKRALIFIWKTLNFISSHRMKPFIKEILPRLREKGYLNIHDEIAEKLLRISRATIDRLLKNEKIRLKRKKRCTTKPGTLLKCQIPIRVGEWKETEPGYAEIDLVPHCGDSVSGQFAYTLNFTDINTAWFEAEAVLGKAQERAFKALKNIRARLPFPLKGIDSDNDSAFINHQLKRYCDKENITFTRSRPYKKNDNAHIEQKNWTCVREIFGYIRIETEESIKLMNILYQGPLRLYINFFQPVQKCVRKIRQGSKIKKRYDTAKTPYQRIKEFPHIDRKTKMKLTMVYKNLYPVLLFRKINKILNRIEKIEKNKKRYLTPTYSIQYFLSLKQS
ncbi:MAG: ISNCY family transposase [Methanosarcinales archaeon]